MKTSQLERECRVYTRYFIGQDPGNYVVQKYREYHELFSLADRNLLDRVLLALSRQGTLATRLADVYASRFAKHSALRRKLSLVLALLESSGPSFRFFDSTESSKPFMVYCRMAYGMAFYIVALIVATGGLLPVHLLSLALPSRGKD